MTKVAILAGGGSRRMGRDKAALAWHGSDVLAHLVAVVRTCGREPVVVGRTDGGAGVAAIPDREPGLGPLGGVVTALRHVAGDCIVLACDLPLLDAAALEWLLARGDVQAEHGLVPRCDGRLEPCFARYRRAVLSAAEERLASGRRSLHGLVAEGAFATPELPAAHRAAVTNVNTPADWRAIGGPT